jgi:aryl-alcohol dehydrogenase-like predicted oxidoreductase
VAKNPNTSTIILGVTSPQQLLDNLKALEVLPKLTDNIMEQIEKILDNKPEIDVSCSTSRMAWELIVRAIG